MQRKKQMDASSKAPIRKPSDPAKPTTSKESNASLSAAGTNMIDINTFVLAIGLRIIAAVFLSDYLSRSPEFVTPWNSFKRIKEAIHMVDEYKLSPYEGDSFHLMPLFLKIVGPFTYFPQAYIALSIGLDIATSMILQYAAQMYLRRKSPLPNTIDNIESYSKYVALMYLFNPMTIGSCAVGSISTLLNFIIASFIHSLFKNCFALASILVTIVIFVYPYYIVLLAPLIVAAKNQRLITMATLFASTGALFALNCLIEKLTKFFPDTFYFFWSVPDLSPNVGLFWYFFVFIFDQYHSFFIWTFQLASVLPVIPLALTLQDDVAVLIFGCIGHVTVLSSYPSYAEAAILLALYPMFAKFLRYSRYTLLSFGSIVASLVLSPIMWRMWMITGSGNANFYFANVIVYIVALSFLIIDIMYNYARFQFAEECAKAGIPNAEKIPEEYAIQGMIPFLPAIKSKLLNLK